MASSCFAQIILYIWSKEIFSSGAKRKEENSWNLHLLRSLISVTISVDFGQNKWVGVLLILGRILRFPPLVFMVVIHRRSQVVELWRRNSNWRPVARKVMEIVVSFLRSQKTENTENSLVKSHFNFIFDIPRWDFPSFSLSNFDFKPFPRLSRVWKIKTFF